MKVSEDIQHIILLVITSVLFLLFITGLAVPSDTAVDTAIFTS